MIVSQRALHFVTYDLVTTFQTEGNDYTKLHYWVIYHLNSSIKKTDQLFSCKEQWTRRQDTVCQLYSSSTKQLQECAFNLPSPGLWFTSIKWRNMISVITPGEVTGLWGKIILCYTRLSHTLRTLSLSGPCSLNASNAPQ